MLLILRKSGKKGGKGLDRELPLGAKIKCLGGRLDQQMNEMFRQWQLTAAQAQILFYLYHRQQEAGPVNIRALSRWLRQSHVTVLGVIDRMEQKGFVRTETDPKDKRSRCILLTDRAHQAKADIGARFRAANEALVRGFTPEEQAALGRMMDRLLENAGALQPAGQADTHREGGTTC